MRLWTRTSAGGSWSLHDQFTTDPFGDEFNTIGLQISTKKRGAISASCLLGDDDPDKDCSSDLDDVTLYYKDAEPSSAGQCDSYSDDTCKPTFSTDSDRRRTTAMSLAFPLGIGVSPRASNPLVNEPGHYESGMTVNVPFVNNNAESANVSCSFLAYVADYRGLGHVNASIASSLIGSEVVTQEVAAGVKSSCEFTINREDYSRFALTYLDSEGEMPVSGKQLTQRLSRTPTLDI